MITTGFDFPGYSITKTCGLVIGKSTALEASLADKNGQSLLQKSLSEAEANILTAAKKVGGNAVIGCRTETIRPPVGFGSGLIHFVLIGTAVTISPILNEASELIETEDRDHKSATCFDSGKPLPAVTPPSEPVKPIDIDHLANKCTCPHCQTRQRLDRTRCMNCGAKFEL